MSTYPDTEKKDISTESFEEYRRRTHPEMDENGHMRVKPAKHTMWLRAFFGLFMIVVYVGMGVLFVTNYFDWPDNWTWVRWLIGVILIVYGVFRGFRFYKGIDYSYN